MSSGLEVAKVSKTFGGLRALTNVSLRVPPASVFGLIGPNGAGKTTLLNLVTGFGAPDPGGSIAFRGTPLAGRGPVHAARAGVARTFQNIRLFERLSVLDNVLVGAEVHQPARLLDGLFYPRRARTLEADRRDRALELLELFGLTRAADRPPGSLSYGDRRRLEMARALMAAPRLLLLDEPAAGMNQGEAAALAGRVRALRDRFGLTVVLVEHNVGLVMSLCDVVHVLDHGETVAEGAPADIREHPAVLEAYLGRAASLPPPRPLPTPPPGASAPPPGGSVPPPRVIITPTPMPRPPSAPPGRPSRPPGA
ncbi:MAG TPA: ABC transporter ATP-binding protein [Polyangiaceae bacterium]|nr:ABC transporter ATP-binding protein [Polyangiaceae bacterium]